MPRLSLLPSMTEAHRSRTSVQPHTEAPLDPCARQPRGEGQRHKMRPVNSNPSLYLNYMYESSMPDAGGSYHRYLWGTKLDQKPGGLFILKRLIQLSEAGSTRLDEQLLGHCLVFCPPVIGPVVHRAACISSVTRCHGRWRTSSVTQSLFSLCLHPARRSSPTGSRHVAAHATILCV